MKFRHFCLDKAVTSFYPVILPTAKKLFISGKFLPVGDIFFPSLNAFCSSIIPLQGIKLIWMGQVWL
jgi:hypothetical protein